MPQPSTKILEFEKCLTISLTDWFTINNGKVPGYYDALGVKGEPYPNGLLVPINTEVVVCLTFDPSGTFFGTALIRKEN